MQIHQFVESLVDGDAISYYALQVRNHLRSKNINSEIFAVYQDEFGKKESRQYFEFLDYLNGRRSRDRCILLFHFSIYSKQLGYFYQIKSAKKILIFHNVTSPEFFPVDSLFRKNDLERAYRQIKSFNNIFEFAIADSNYNAKILAEKGFKKKIYVIPPFVNINNKFQKYLNLKFTKKANVKKIIFISQFNFHKRQEDVAKIFNIYNRYFNQNSKLFLIGGFYTHEEYFLRVRQLSQENSNIILTGKLPLKDLVFHYKTSDLYLCMSEHEGFAVPLIEAMFFKVPIIAYDAGAVAETLGSGGILVKKKDYFMIASLIDRFLADKNLINIIKENQEKELKRFDYKLIEEKLDKCLLKKI